MEYDNERSLLYLIWEARREGMVLIHELIPAKSQDPDEIWSLAVIRELKGKNVYLDMVGSFSCIYPALEGWLESERNR